MRNACGIRSLDALVNEISEEAGGFGRSGGVAAFDVMAGASGNGGRSRELSMATMVHMAMDNSWLLYPLRLPTELLGRVPMPFILLHKNHYQLVRVPSISSQRNPAQWLDTISPEEIPCDLAEEVLVLALEPLTEFVISLEEASEYKGSENFIKGLFRGTSLGTLTGGGSFGSRLKNAFNPDYLSRQFVKKNPVAPYAGYGLGVVPYVGPLLAAGYGAYRARQTPEGQPPGSTSDIVRGAVGGYLQGAGGATVAGGIRGAIGAGAGSRIAGFAAGAKAGGSAYFAPFSSGAGGGPIGAGRVAGANLAAPGAVAGQAYGPQPATPPAYPVPVGGGEFSAYDFGGQGASGLATIGVGDATGILNNISQEAGKGSFQEWFSQPSSKIGLASFLASAAIPTPELQGPAVTYDQIAELAARGPMTASGKAVEAEVIKVLGAPYGKAYAAIAEPYARQAQELVAKNFAENRRAINQRFEAAGMLNSGQHMDALRRMDEQEAAEVRNVHADVAVKLAAHEGDLRAAFAGIGLQLDRQQMGDLLGITGLNVSQAAYQYGARVEDIQSLRRMFADAGTLFVAHSLGLAGQGQRNR